MVYLTRKEHFNAAHRLHVAQWSSEKNLEVFGKCSNKNWHGHNYELLVTVKGAPDKDTGFIINARDLSEVIKKNVLDKLDHKNLSVDVDFMQGIQPSTENLAKAIWNELLPHLKEKLYCIKIVETENIYAEYYGE
ncbi:MAG TPA: 6-carboxytetrahydropterin synthase [Flavobacterium sp.]|nr:6-carboxytetrahydropterin synthase [Flavobacterium sp.]